MTHRLILIAHNLRSCHNVGSLLRTAEGLGVAMVYLTGYTPYPAGREDDVRLPHLARKIDSDIHKTALGAETMVPWQHSDTLEPVLARLRADGCTILALEQHPRSVPLPSLRPVGPTALLVGREVEGIEPEVLAQCDAVIEIPMLGRKESFNVAAAAAMALYHLRYAPSHEALSPPL